MRTPTSESNGGIAAWIGAVASRSKRVFRHSALGAGGRGASGRGASARARRRVAPLALFAALLGFALAPASAQALLVHGFSFGSATSTPADPYPLSSPQGVAVDNSTGASNGDVYVVDALNFRVEKFDGSGNFILAFGKGVNKTTGGDVCTAASGNTCQAGTQGSSAGEFEAPQFIAVDNSTSAGDVYVGDPGDDTISKFDSSGNLITTWGTGGQLSGSGTFGSIYGITVDSSGNLLVINSNNALYEFAQSNGAAVTNFATTRGMSPSGLDLDASGHLFKVNGDTSAEELTITSNSSTDVGQVSLSGSGTTEIAVDRSSGDLYVDTGTKVGHFEFNGSGQVIEPGSTPCNVGDGGCNPTDTFGTNVLSSGTGVGFDSSTTTAYVADKGNNDVAVFVPPAPGPPVIDGESASNVGNQSATINALVNPFGNDTTCEFEYGTTTSYGTTVPCPADLGSSFADQSASVNLTGLTLNTTYHFRVVAFNSAAPSGVDGADQTFTTLGAATIIPQPASGVGSTYATLNTQVNPLGNDTTCEFEYGTSTAYGSTVACSPADLGAGTSNVSATASLTGLAINTTYHFRVVVTNSLAPSGEDGPDQTFTTLGAALIDSESASSVTQTTATLNAQINPLGTDTTCEFEYGTTASYGTTVACPTDLGAGKGDVSASVDVSGLLPGTTYHFRVVAFNSLQPGGVDGSDQTFTTVPPVSIDSESVANVTDSSATLEAQINPEGTDTTYQFQYGTDTSYSGGMVPATPVDIGSAPGDQSASFTLSGLQPNTTYHFRVVATNALVPSGRDGADRTFRTYPSGVPTGLPDGRGYEMVSPVAKADGELYSSLLGGTVAPIVGDQASPDGNEMAYLSLTSFPGSTGPGFNYVGTRTAGGWSTQALLPPQAPGASLELPMYVAFSSDLSKAVLANGGGAAESNDFGQDDPPLVPGTCTSASPLTTPCSGEPPGLENLFVRDNSNGSFQLVNNLEGAPSGVSPSDANFDGASADLSRVVFGENAKLTGNAPAGNNLYDWSGGTVNLVGMLPVAPATACTSACQAAGGGTLGGSDSILNAISDDGSRIFFSDGGDLYVRENDSSTVQVDAAATGAPGPGGGGQFMTASTDGSEVLFTDGDSAGLTGDTVSGSGQNLYVYDVATGTLTDLTGGQSAAEVDGVVGASDDGSYVYFVAQGVLASNANAQGQTAMSGGENLYVNHAGATTFIATLSGSDSSDWSGTSTCQPCYTARVTPDGTHLAFDSVQSLTGYDNTDASTGSADTEIFLYGASSNTLVCASCNPSGAQPIGSSQLESIEPGLLAGGSEYLPRNLSDDGSRLFFDSSDALLPRDTNGQQDVYEYENGQVYLISSGTSTDTSTFLDASSDGSDVFFMTRQQLVPQDTDAGNLDLYDARVNGGFPVTVTTPCSGDNCKPPTTPPPVPPTVATVSFVGPGNATPGAPPTAQVAVSSTKVLKGFKFSVVVIVPGKGKITISGAGVKTVSKSVKHAGSFKLTVGLTTRQRNALTKKRKRKLKLTVHIGYKPATGQSSSATVTVTVKA